MPMNAKITLEQARNRGFTRVGLTAERAVMMAEGYRLTRIEGLSQGDAAVRLGRSVSYLRRAIVWPTELCAALYEEPGELTTATATRIYRQWIADMEALEEERGCAVVEEEEDSTESGASAVAPASEDEEEVPVSFSFLDGRQLSQWMRSLRAGVPLLVACDAAGIDRDAPLAWIAAAQGGSEEHMEFVRVSRATSAGSFVKLSELVVRGAASKVQFDYLSDGFALFDDTSKDEAANKELSALVGQALIGMKEAADARRGGDERLASSRCTPLRSVE